MSNEITQPFFRPSAGERERSQKAVILRLALAVTALASIPIAILNLQQGATAFAAVLLVVAGACVFGLWLGKTGHDRLAAGLLCFLVFLAITFTLIDGAGLEDPAIVALPLFILISGFFFGMPAVLASTALSIGTVLSLFVLDRVGVLTLAAEPSPGRVVTICILLAAAAALVGVALRTWEGSLAALRQSEQRLDLAIHASGLAMWDWDLRTERLGVNDIWLASFGYPPDFAPSAQDWTDRIHPDDREWVMASLQAHLDGQTAAWSPQYRLIPMQGGLVWLQCLGRVMERDAQGKPLRVTGVHLDITERRQAEAALVHSERRFRVLSRELHDSVTQTLYSITLTLKAARIQWERDPANLTGLLTQLDGLAKSALEEMRTLLRQARPEVLEREGLVAAMRDHLEGLRLRGELEAIFEVEGDARLPVEAELALYRICQEALNNVIKHAGAVRARVRLTFGGGLACLDVEDQGKGFDPTVASPMGESMGLISMRDRAEALGGRCEISSAPGEGTRLHVEIPVASEIVQDA
jgi:two-component system sensor histidine kinase UhpB